MIIIVSHWKVRLSSRMNRRARLKRKVVIRKVLKFVVKILSLFLIRNPLRSLPFSLMVILRKFGSKVRLLFARRPSCRPLKFLLLWFIILTLLRLMIPFVKPLKARLKMNILILIPAKNGRRLIPKFLKLSQRKLIVKIRLLRGLRRIGRLMMSRRRVRRKTFQLKIPRLFMVKFLLTPVPLVARLRSLWFRDRLLPRAGVRV